MFSWFSSSTSKKIKDKCAPNPDDVSRDLKDLVLDGFRETAEETAKDLFSEKPTDGVVDSFNKIDSVGGFFGNSFNKVIDYFNGIVEKERLCRKEEEAKELVMPEPEKKTLFEWLKNSIVTPVLNELWEMTEKEYTFHEQSIFAPVVPNRMQCAPNLDDVIKAIGDGVDVGELMIEPELIFSPKPEPILHDPRRLDPNLSRDEVLAIRQRENTKRYTQGLPQFPLDSPIWDGYNWLTSCTNGNYSIFAGSHDGKSSLLDGGLMPDSSGATIDYSNCGSDSVGNVGGGGGGGDDLMNIVIDCSEGHWESNGDGTMSCKY